MGMDDCGSQGTPHALRRHYISRKIALAILVTSGENMLEIDLVYMVSGK